ncbi:MAG: chlorite dismutase family protein [Anaerolineales bacterium]
MSETTAPTLNHFALYSFSEQYWQHPSDEQTAFRGAWLSDLRSVAQSVNVYQVFPSEGQTDILVWSAVSVKDHGDTAAFFAAYARAASPHRTLIRPGNVLWGYTRPSQYTKTRSTQEIDPFAQTRSPYLVVYPFVKTKEWYFLSREARQGMMNEHIRIGKQYAEIKQLLLYSTGLQSQEFVVVYETNDLALFSSLVTELRSTEARRFTERDTPLFTAVYHPAEETLALFR